jgi:hypothetical protein
MAIIELGKTYFDWYMKNTFISLLFIALLMIGTYTAGCTSTATQPEQVDPIIGTWQISTEGGSTYTDVFFSDGRFSLTTPNTPRGGYLGTWSKINQNAYMIKIGDATENFIYHPDTDTVTLASVPTTYFHRIKQVSLQTSETTDTLCGELVYCGIAPADFKTQPIKSDRCEQLAALRMQNDQKVISCLKNPYESQAATSRELLYCLQGMGDLEDCYKVADKNGITHASMKSSWCRTNTC